MTSKFKSINWRDLVKGAIVAGLAVLLEGLQQLLKAKGLGWAVSDISPILAMTLDTSVGYLIKNFFTDENGKLGGVL